MNHFTVLLPVYIGDKAQQFERALRSVGADQTLCPDEILVVCDGPVTADIEELLIQCEARDRMDLHGTATVTVLRLEQNHGLSAALNAGIEHARHDIIARVDADDIAVPTRFEVQIPLMDTHDLVGSAIVEFDDDEDTLGLVRTMPLTAGDIRRVLTCRDPFNHPTVVYRRQAVQQAGGYEHIHFMEDYWLFARMVHGGARCMNVPDALVKYRIGAGAYVRRGGRQLLASECELQRRLLAAGITNRVQYWRNLALRGGYRMIHPRVRKALYHGVGRLMWFTPKGASRQE